MGEGRVPFPAVGILFLYVGCELNLEFELLIEIELDVKYGIQI